MLNIENKIIINKYHITDFPFYKIFSKHCLALLSCSELGKLHEYIPNDLKPDRILRVGEDQSTHAHKLLYQIDPRYDKNSETRSQIEDLGFIKTYESFIIFLESEVFQEKLVYQKLPTLRIHFPGNLSVGEYHRDRDYNHPIEEVNIWVPVTQARGTATIHMESSYDAGDFRPIELKYGEYLIFDSSLKHGNEVNIEGYTRVSFDFRVIPISKYKDCDLASINQKMTFKIGDYYNYQENSP